MVLPDHEQPERTFFDDDVETIESKFRSDGLGRAKSERVVTQVLHEHARGLFAQGEGSEELSDRTLVAFDQVVPAFREAAPDQVQSL